MKRSGRSRAASMTGAQWLVVTSAALGLVLAGSVGVPLAQDQFGQASRDRAQATAISAQHSAPGAKRDAARLRAAVPAEPALDAALATLSAQVSRSGLSLASVSTSRAADVTVGGADPHPVGVYELTVELRGPAGSVAGLLRAVSAGERLVVPVQVRVSPGSSHLVLRVFTEPAGS